MLYSFKFSSWAIRGLLAVIVCLMGCSVMSCSDEPDENSDSWDNIVHIRLLSKDGQNLFTVDPELNSLIDEEFVVKIQAGPYKEEEYQVIRALVHSWEDTTFNAGWVYDNLKYYDTWRFNDEGKIVKFGRERYNYAQLSPLYGFSPHDKLSHEIWNMWYYCLTASYYSLSVGYGEWDYDKSDRTFYVTIEWPRGGMVWNFEHFIPAGHKGDKLMLNGKEVKKKDLHDGYFLDFVVEDESLYQGHRYQAI